MAGTEAPRRTMSIEEFCQVFGIGRRLAYEQASRDSLPVPVIRIGKRMLVSRDAVDHLLANERMGGGAA